MRGYIVFLKKELVEAAKTYKLIVLGAVFLIFGLMSPLFAKMMPEIMKWAMASDPATAGIDLSSLFTDPKALDAWAQFYNNIGQIGLIVLVIVFSGMLSAEISRGTLTIILTKGLTRCSAILAKFSSAVLVWTVCLSAAFFTSWGYTVYFFPGESLPHIGYAIFILWVYGLFLLALTTLAAALTKSTIFCMLTVGCAVVFLMLVNIIPYVSKYNPYTLAGLPISLIADTITVRSTIPALVTAFILIIITLLLAVISFDRTKKTKITAVFAIILSVSLFSTIIISEEIPARITLSRHVITENITIGEGTEWELKGKLTLPRKAEGKVPAVVLVHGSGASDMDERIFDNRPFKEIAEHLSANGVAVIRYNKRPYTHGLKMMQEGDGSFTVYHETIEDAILATEILRSDPRIDENRIFILGHSLGGVLAPRISDMGGDYAGLIIFAGSPRFLLDIMIDQQELSLITMEEGEAKDVVISQQNEFNEKVRSGIKLSDEEAKAMALDEFGGISVYYFKDLYENPVSKYLERFDRPILVMHPENDLQVYVDKDFNLYKELLAGRNNVTFKLYEGLNHLFMPSKVTDINDIMTEYKIKSRIEKQVLVDIAEWIKAN